MSPAYAGYPSSSTAYPRVAVKEADRTSLIHALVSQLLSRTECSELARQAYHNRLFSYAMRLLGSTLGPAQGGDAASLVHGMRLKLQQQQREGDASRQGTAKTFKLHDSAHARQHECTQLTDSCLKCV